MWWTSIHPEGRNNTLSRFTQRELKIDIVKHALEPPGAQMRKIEITMLGLSSLPIWQIPEPVICNLVLFITNIMSKNKNTFFLLKTSMIEENSYVCFTECEAEKFLSWSYLKPQTKEYYKNIKVKVV